MRRLPALAFLIALARTASAQLSVDASASSDYMYRGVSLTDGRPTAALSANYDDASGWFAGGLVTATRLEVEGHRYEPEAVVDAGFAHALVPGLTWEAGASYAVFTHFTFWNYGEAFVGVLGERWSARLSYSPDYFGRERRTWYAEVNASLPIDDRFSWTAHAGEVHVSTQAYDPYPNTLDASLGVAARFGSAHLQLRRTFANHESYLYSTLGSGERGAWVLSVAYSY